MKKIIIFLLLSNFLLAEEINEDSLFGNENVIEKPPSLSENPAEKESVTLTGRAGSTFSYSFSKDYLERKIGSESNVFSYNIDGDLFFDVRLKKGYKFFSDIWFLSQNDGTEILRTFYDPFTGSYKIFYETNEVILKVKELFLDYNFSHVVYLRAGKQFLKWGTTYFWNPVDVINREKKSFTDLEATREGVWGIKMHIPYKTLFNFYSFIDFSDVKKIEDSALATKMELLFANTEVGLYGWFKKDFYSVYGFDISTRIFDIDIKGEGSFSYGDNRKYLKEEISNFNIMGNDISVTNYSSQSIENEVVYRLSLNLYKGFEFLDKKDRITLMFEMFYHSKGYEINIFDNEQKRNFAIYNNLYVPNEYGRFYTLLMIGYKDLFISDLNLSLNQLMNWSDYTSQLCLSSIYSPVDNVSLSLSIYGFIGKEDGEYTYLKMPVAINVGFEMKF